MEERKQLKVVAAILVYDGRILCMQRPEGKNPETSWKYEFPGGKMEPGESRTETLERELREEMDLTLSFSEKDAFAESAYRYASFDVALYTYRKELASPEFTRKEHIDHKWLLPEELDRLDWAPADFPVVRKLMEGE